MRGLTLLSTALLGVTLSAARAQHRQEATYFLRHPAGQPAYVRPLLPVGTGLPAAVPPSAALKALPAPGRLSQRLLTDSLPLTPRRDVTGVPPPYDLYRNLPEDFRKHTLPAVYTEPLPVQLLRGLLGQ